MNILFRWLSATPPVLWHAARADDPIGSYLPGNMPVLRFAFAEWHRTAAQWADWYRYAKARRPKDTIRLTVNTQEVATALIDLGIPVLHINQNCMASELEFDIRPTTAKRFDAVYVARMAPFKRHKLMQQLANAVCIGGTPTTEDSQEYFEEVRAALPAVVFTHQNNLRLSMPPTVVANYLNMSRVGLCLSAEEGAMFACIEYLLCGLPVVTTQCIGGREFWLHKGNSVTVDATPKAVAEGVATLMAKNINPYAIRADAIDLMAKHRTKLCEVGQQFYRSTFTPQDFTRVFYKRLVGPYQHWHPASTVMTMYERMTGKRGAR